MAVIIDGTTSPYDYQPYNNNNPPQITATEWQLSPGASIAVLVCLPIAALLFFMIGTLVGIERTRAMAKKKKNDNGNQNPGGGLGDHGGVVGLPAPPANGTGDQVAGNAGQVENPGQVGNPGQAATPA